jgi:hypothetical protein
MGPFAIWFRDVQIKVHVRIHELYLRDGTLQRDDFAGVVFRKDRVMRQDWQRH